MWNATTSSFNTQSVDWNATHHAWSTNAFKWSNLNYTEFPAYCAGGTWVSGVNSSNVCTAPVAADIDPGTFPAGDYKFTGSVDMTSDDVYNVKCINFSNGGSICVP